MNKISMLYAIPYLHPELPPDEQKAVKWAHKMLTDIRFRELKSNLKNHDFEINGDYRIDGNEAKKILSFIDEIQGQDGDGDV